MGLLQLRWSREVFGSIPDLGILHVNMSLNKRPNPKIAPRADSILILVAMAAVSWGWQFGNHTINWVKFCS